MWGRYVQRFKCNNQIDDEASKRWRLNQTKVVRYDNIHVFVCLAESTKGTTTITERSIFERNAISKMIHFICKPYSLFIVFHSFCFNTVILFYPVQSYPKILLSELGGRPCHHGSDQGARNGHQPAWWCSPVSAAWQTQHVLQCNNQCLFIVNKIVNFLDFFL